MDNSNNFSQQNILSERTRVLNNSFQNNNTSGSDAYDGKIGRENENFSQDKNSKKKSSIINLTSGELKKEYIKKFSYLKNRITFIFIISILSIINSLMEYKYLKPSELNTILMIMSFLTTGLSFILIVNINAKALIDTFGYQAFYAFSIIETFIFFSLLILKIYYFINVTNELHSSNICEDRIKCPENSILLFLFIFNCVIILLNLFCVKFICKLFLEGIRIFLKKEKTLFERQLELNKNKKNENNRSIDCIRKEKLDSNKENNRDKIKKE